MFSCVFVQRPAYLSNPTNGLATGISFWDGNHIRKRTSHHTRELGIFRFGSDDVLVLWIRINLLVCSYVMPNTTAALERVSASSYLSVCLSVPNYIDMRIRGILRS